MPTKIPNEIVENRIRMLEQEIHVYEQYEYENKATMQVPPQKLDVTKPSKASTRKVGEELTNNSQVPKVPKKRGPKKKQMTPARVAKFKLRRIKANARERSRMHGLNEALELLRDVMPSFNMVQRLSKIETLRLAFNYIGALSDILQENCVTDNKTFAEKLCMGLSQNTMNLIANALEVNPRTMNYTDILKDYDLMNASACNEALANSPKSFNPSKNQELMNHHVNMQEQKAFVHEQTYSMPPICQPTYYLNENHNPQNYYNSQLQQAPTQQISNFPIVSNSSNSSLSGDNNSSDLDYEDTLMCVDMPMQIQEIPVHSDYYMQLNNSHFNYINGNNNFQNDFMMKPVFSTNRNLTNYGQYANI